MSKSTIAAEILGGSGLSLSQAARRFPPFRETKPIAPSTIFRWIAEGVRLPNGSRVRLEAVRLGGRWLTSVPAIERFIARQTPKLDTDTTAAPSLQSAQEAGCALKELGI
jgi:hypothetical protein